MLAGGRDGFDGFFTFFMRIRQGLMLPGEVGRSSLGDPHHGPHPNPGSLPVLLTFYVSQPRAAALHREDI